MKQKLLISFILMTSLIFSCIASPIGYAKDFQTLDQFVESSAKKYPQLSVYYQNLSTGYSYSYKTTNIHSAASTIKLPLALYVYELAANKKINLNEKLTYKSSHYYGGSGVIQYDKVGTKYTIKDLLKKAIVYSDNIAFIMLREKVGKTNFINYAKSIGGKVVYPGGKNVTTVQDLSKYLQHVMNFSKKNPALGNELVALLKNTVYKDTVAKSLNPSSVAHKVGYIPANKIYNDAALVYDEQPYILVVMTQGIPVGQDVKFISQLAEIVQQEHDTSKISHFVSLLANAEKSKVQLQKEISVDYEANAEVRPYNTFNMVKNQLTKAKSAYKLLNKKEQEKHLYRIQDTELWIKRATYYIDAISAGERLEKTQKELETYLNDGNMEMATNQYHHLSALIKQQAVFLYKPYGKSTRDAILDRYKTPAGNAIQNSLYPISVHLELEKLKGNFATNNTEEIEKNKALIETWLPLIKQDNLKETLREKYEQISGVMK